MPTDKAAWAYVILHDGHAMTATGGKVGATNNQMEMTAVLEGLKALLKTWDLARRSCCFP
ncbi:hypothetical protein ACXO63_05800 [Lactobacillus delbrueckii subsp. bulgaricus]